MPGTKRPQTYSKVEFSADEGKGYFVRAAPREIHFEGSGRGRPKVDFARRQLREVHFEGICDFGRG